MPICVDASFVLRLVVIAEGSDRAAEAWREWTEEGRLILAPSLLQVEASNALRRYEAQGLLTRDEALSGLDLLLRLDIVMVQDPALSRRALELALEHDLPATHDAHYLALAERSGATFVTADRRLVRRVGETLPWVQELA